MTLEEQEALFAALPIEEQQKMHTEALARSYGFSN